MEEDKAAAYYDELTRKGEGAARFKQGLGFSSGSNSDSAPPPAKGSAFVSSSSSFLSSFVRASSPEKTSQLEKQAQLTSIQNKLKKSKPEDRKGGERRRSRSRERDRDRDRDRDRERDRYSRRRSRSRERDRYRERDKERDRDRERDRERDRDRDREREKDRERRRRRSRSRSRSLSPRRSEKRRSGRGEKDEVPTAAELKKERNGGKATDFSKLIDGYDKMTPAERVKAKMKLQLAETVERDEANGMGPGWERFQFDKDAPLDDEEIEAVEDDAALVKHIGQSFRFSAIETRREEQLKAAHDEAMFGSSAHAAPAASDIDSDVEKKQESNENVQATSLLSEKVLSRQQGSWRDRARKV